MTRVLVLIACLGLAVTSATAAAGEASPDALIEQGLAQRRSGNPERALELFRQAHALAPSARTFGQMGLVEASLKQWVEAENHLSMSLANPDDAWVRKNRAFLDEALTVCRRHVGELVVTGPAGTEVFVAGRSIGTLPTVPAVRLPEGTVAITASAPGYKAFEQSATITAGERSQIVLAMAPIVPPPAPPPVTPVAAPILREPGPPPESSGGWHVWAGASLAAAGTAALAWGIVWIAVNGRTAGDGTLYETRTPGLVLAGAGAAALIGGAAIFFTAPRADSKTAVAIAPGSFLIRARF
ncbi:MAG TPA: tetratricopeptide repeat protein [Polyangia bacterium]|nr:tetratricopeptide repeat protein [Polyangia bacterium]